MIIFIKNKSILNLVKLQCVCIKTFIHKRKVVPLFCLTAYFHTPCDRCLTVREIYNSDTYASNTCTSLYGKSSLRKPA